MPPVVKAVIEGKCHMDTIRRRLNMKPKRMPVTLAVLGEQKWLESLPVTVQPEHYLNIFYMAQRVKPILDKRDIIRSIFTNKTNKIFYN